MGVSAILGPDRGGFHHLGQHRGLGLRPVFLINIILGLVGLLAAFSLLPRDRPSPARRSTPSGAVLLGTSMLALIFGLIQGSPTGGEAFRS